MTHDADPAQPDLERARQTATLAHGVVVKLKGMGLPSNLDDAVASVSTDLGDLWAAQQEMSALLEQLLDPSTDWEALGDALVDLRSAADHMGWHARRLRGAANKVARFAYAQASRK